MADFEDGELVDATSSGRDRALLSPAPTRRDNGSGRRPGSDAGRRSAEGGHRPGVTNGTRSGVLVGGFEGFDEGQEEGNPRSGGYGGRFYDATPSGDVQVRLLEGRGLLRARGGAMKSSAGTPRVVRGSIAPWKPS